MDDWKGRATNADKKAALALSLVAEVIGKLGNLVEKLNEFDGKLKEV